MKAYFENDIYIIPFDKVMYVQKFVKPYSYIDLKFTLSITMNHNDYVEKISLRDDDAVRFMEEYKKFYTGSDPELEIM
ncbi:MAG TPA: hypothetical protein PLE74_09400 [Candidatus Cloacimonadota bacterium]|nr:hypothetical protein [Candidatus Cloacimonadota bacterium]HPT72481.1 hypothetical protein [Candidatus Cloacimonadota bacterium]